MSNLAVGCELTGTGVIPGSVETPALISALVTPATAPLYDGQALRDVPDYAQMVSPGNFSSNRGNIIDVQVNFTGDATAADGVLAEGQSAGFVVTVIDDAGTPPRQFVAAPVMVEYKFRITTTSTNEANLDINPLVSDSEALPFTISEGGAYDGSYAPIAGAVRAGPVNLVAPRIDGPPDPGNTLTSDSGLWVTSTGTLGLTRQWVAGGLGIAGETDHELLVSEALSGLAVAIEVSADDGVSLPVVAVSPPVLISGSGLSVAQLGGIRDVAISSSDPVTETLIMSSAMTDRKLVILAVWGRSGGAGTLDITVTRNGFPITVHDPIQVNNVSHSVTGFHFDAPETGEYTLSMSVAAGGSWRNVDYVVLEATGVTQITGVPAVGTAPETQIFDVDVAPGDYIVAGVIMNNKGTTGDFAWSGITEIWQSDGAGKRLVGLASETVTVGATPREVRAVITGDAAGAIASGLLHIL